MSCKHQTTYPVDVELGRMYGHQYDIVKINHETRCVDCGRITTSYCDSYKECHEGYVEPTLTSPARFGT